MTITFVWFFLTAVACEPSRYKNVYDRPIGEMDKALSALPVTEQVDAYVWGMTHVKPRPSYLDSVLVDNPSNTIPALRKRLQRESGEHEIRILIEVFMDMAYKQKHDVKADQELMNLINIKAASIENETTRERVFEAIKVIEGKAIPDYARPITEIRKMHERR